MAEWCRGYTKLALEAACAKMVAAWSYTAGAMEWVSKAQTRRNEALAAWHSAKDDTRLELDYSTSLMMFHDAVENYKRAQAAYAISQRFYEAAFAAALAKATGADG